jgi:hypothetical protein
MRPVAPPTALRPNRQVRMASTLKAGLPLRVVRHFGVWSRPGADETAPSRIAGLGQAPGGAAVIRA